MVRQSLGENNFNVISHPLFLIFSDFPNVFNIWLSLYMLYDSYVKNKLCIIILRFFFLHFSKKYFYKITSMVCHLKYSSCLKPKRWFDFVIDSTPPVNMNDMNDCLIYVRYNCYGEYFKMVSPGYEFWNTQKNLMM